MVNKRKVVVLTTGGTIAMKYDEKTKGLVPAVNGKDLMMAVPELKDICKIDVIEFSNIPSPQMTPATMFNLSKKVEAVLKQKDVSGVVITHGTDTLEETAYFLDCAVKSNKPICLTASMRGASEISPDGPKNILCAVKVASCKEAIGKGAMVVMNEEIHSAKDVTKSHSSSVSTFVSPIFGAIGYVDCDRVIFKRTPTDRDSLTPKEINDNVYLIKAFIGMDNSIFEFLASKKIAGLVLEGFGRGNLPAVIIEGVKKVVNSGAVVVLSSRVFGGRVLDVYSYNGSTTTAINAGAILSNGLNGQKARIKLILALGITRSKSKLKKIFEG